MLMYYVFSDVLLTSTRHPSPFFYFFIFLVPYILENHHDLDKRNTFVFYFISWSRH